MTSALFDIAKYIIDKYPLSISRLQQLLYYCQLYSYFLKNKPMFEEEIEFWSYSVVIPKLYMNQEKIVFADSKKVKKKDKKIIDEVLDHFKDYSSQQLNDCIYRELHDFGTFVKVDMKTFRESNG
jgi:uncharacterized phage-associated protein